MLKSNLSRHGRRITRGLSRFSRRENGTVPLVSLFAAVVLAVAPAAAAKDNKANEYRKRQQRAAYEQRIRQNQMRLKALEREGSVIRQQVQHLEKQIPAARAKIKSAQQQMQTTAMQVDSARVALEEAEAEAKRVSENLAVVAEDVEKGQPSDSPFAKARNAYLAAKQEYAGTVEKIVNSLEYKEAYGRATQSGSTAALVLQLRKEWIDNDPAVTAARSQLKITKTAYDRLRSEVLRGDSGWLEQSRAAERAREQESEADKQARSIAGRYATMKRYFARMQRELKAMETTLPRGKAALKRIPEMKRQIQRQIDNDRRARDRVK